jgi:cyclic beta-1,2-glucan synthetase
MLSLRREPSLRRKEAVAPAWKPPSGSADEHPIQSQLFSSSELERHARTLASGHELSVSSGKGPDRLLPRLAANEVALREAHALVTQAVKGGSQITPAAEWFIDNYHLVEEQIRTARRHLPRGYSRELPRLGNALVAGTPRVYDLAIEFISHSHGRLDVDGLRAFILSYQEQRPLSLGELWAIPIMLRLALIENLRRIVDSVTAGRRDRERAGLWVEQMLEVAARDPAQVVLVLAEMVRANPPLSIAFVAELASRLSGKGAALLFPISWLEHRMAERGQTVEGVYHLVSQDQAANQVAIGNSIGSLRLLGATDWRNFVEALSLVERILRTDPASVYARMDFATRDNYRRAAEVIAKHSSLSEEDVARAALELGEAGAEGGGRHAHVGHFLVGEGRELLERRVGMRRGFGLGFRHAVRRFRVLAYAGAIALGTASLTALVSAGAASVGFERWRLAAMTLLGFIAASQLVIGIVHWAVTLLVHPRSLPRLDFSEGIPPAHRSFVAVPTLLTDVAEVDRLIESLEVRFLANRDPELGFALLSDFRDAPTETLETDRALLERAEAGILGLNAKYAAPGVVAPFYLFHRKRQYNASEGVWMGWERKRGKLENFNAALRGELGHFDRVIGDTERLHGVRYVIVLDSDTQLPRDAARQLVSTLAHPLNRPSYDAERGRVTEGYGILQPRVAITMASSSASRFARLFASEPGIDPYTRAVSDVYQDLFDEGSFVGKGIYDVDVVRQALDARLPENRILSHDLLEGAHARSGLVSDITLFEDFPSTYAADVSRRYRWMRGDWQITPWLTHRVPRADGRTEPNPASVLSRWKVLDNLRRSLVPIALFSLLAVGWTTARALAATLTVLTVLTLPGLLAAAADLLRRPSEAPALGHLRDVTRTLGRQLLREAFALACLPYEAFISVSAIVRTSGRILLSRRHLLEWRTASDAQRSALTSLPGSYRVMLAAPLAAVIVGGVLAGSTALGFVVAAPVLATWLLAPAVAWWLSQPLSAERPELAARDRAFLRGVARRTWRFFETFVGAADHHLPPDNIQEEPARGVAHRTSPTNIGLSLTANLAAYDFGYISSAQVIERTTRTLDTLEKLGRYRGHFYNWYDTSTLEPLRPIYVSTVDSGNLIGHLIALAAGLRDMAGHATFRAQIFDGLRDTLDVMAALEPAPDGALMNRVGRLQAELDARSSTLSASRQQLERLEAGGRELAIAAAADSAERAAWAEAFVKECREAKDELERLAPWLALTAPLEFATDADRKEYSALLVSLDEVKTLRATALLAQSILPQLSQLPRLSKLEAARVRSAEASDAKWLELSRAVTLASERASERLTALGDLAARVLELTEVDYEFLYDRSRQLLAIGYNVADHRLDASYYDLLASEARLASFVAIAQGKLPQEHWFSLGRLLTTAGGKPALLSWSGSMFEYLMPLLIMPTYARTILDDTYRGVVERQIEYGRERGVPWGVSESGYGKTDAHQNYQYLAFGVPGLGFKRGLADDLVIAPYASAMALMVDPERAAANLQRLAREGMLDAYGFYEAVDYTPSRLPPGTDRVIVRSYMAHHQGMTFLSLAYLLLDRPMQDRFDRNPAFRATDLLLQERVPKEPSIYPHPAEISSTGGASLDAQSTVRVFSTPNTPAPEVHLLSNGTYHVAITNSGGGYSRWKQLAVTRWHEDPTRDGWGNFCYVRDVASGAFWSVAHQPSLVRSESYEAIFSQGRAEFRRRDHGIETHVEISISPEDDVELRRVSLTNHGRSARSIELTTFAEVVLAHEAADAAHPAFSNLFVQTEILPSNGAILCTRRPRSPAERPPWLLHLMSAPDSASGQTSFETSRAEFIGRARTARNPRALQRDELTNSQGSVLDPVISIRNTLVIPPDATLRVHIVTGMAETRGAALALIGKYTDPHSADRVFDLSWTHSQVVLRQLDLTDADTQLYERLASHVIYANPTLRAPRSVIARNKSGQSALWAYGISGDVPIVLLKIADLQHLGLVRQLVKAHTYWRVKGLVADLVIWNEDSSGYRQALQEAVLGVIGPSEASLLDRPGGIFVRRGDQLSEEDRVLMQTVARLIVSDSDGPLSEQVNRRLHVEMPAWLFAQQQDLPPPESARIPKLPVRSLERPDLIAFNGLGGFTHDGREYVITTSAEARTPTPWVNILANPWFGTIVSESGGAYTWCENARTYRLTPWHNDPVGDESGEALYIRDDESGRYWSPTPLPATGTGPYTTRHGFGYSVFEHDEAGLASELHVFVATDAPLKFLVLNLKNRSGRARRLSLTACFDLVLGDRRSTNVPYIVSDVDPQTKALFARNSYSAEFSQRVTFLDSSESSRSVSGDRLEIIGRNQNNTHPACLRRAQLSGRVGASLDACLGMQTQVELANGQERQVVFTFGSGRDLADARALVQRFRGTGAARTALEGVWSYWSRMLGSVNVQTPDVSLNFMANGWLLYQVLAARLFGRSGFYQSGGAFGFRDQLQDAMSLVHAEPGLLREQLLRSASRQFREGDVQHWWHPPLGRGVRTRISDDYLWLPQAVCRYVTTRGDTGVLDERTPFLEGRLVKPDEESYYDLHVRSEESATLYEHCVRAIEHGLRFGEHGLPLMGSGDWNDGMNLVGDGGKGESVWLAFFLYDTLLRFSAIARLKQDESFAERCLSQAATLRENIEAHGWDGAWYRRAYFDSGEPLGSATNPECQIDSLPQSWSILSGAGDESRARQALEAVNQRLVRRELGLIQLFDPPFSSSSLEPGYVKGYVPGVRENGGQYTHAAVWVAMAFAAAGDVERAWELWNLINPVRHGDTPDGIATYKVEPYVVAADVYTNPEHAGRGGWTWYTGSAGWLYRLITESLLGLRLEVDRLRIEPLIPPSWPAFDIHYRYRSAIYHLHIENIGSSGGGRNVTRVSCDSVEQPDKTIPLHDDGREHHVEVEIGGATDRRMKRAI